jgi:four helix bundle protein
VAHAFEKLIVYQRAGLLADEVRAYVRQWDSLDIWTSGVQLIRAADSVAANIAEGGRALVAEGSDSFLPHGSRLRLRDPAMAD